MHSIAELEGSPFALQDPVPAFSTSAVSKCRRSDVLVRDVGRPATDLTSMPQPQNVNATCNPAKGIPRISIPQYLCGFEHPNSGPAIMEEHPLLTFEVNNPTPPCHAGLEVSPDVYFPSVLMLYADRDECVLVRARKSISIQQFVPQTVFLQNRVKRRPQLQKSTDRSG